MNNSSEGVKPALVATLQFLQILQHEAVSPAEAKKRLYSLQANSPQLNFDLVWEEEAYDRSIHYDVLLTVPGTGTVSMSLCPDRAVPWPLRGVHRWSDSALLAVNRTVLKMDQAIACLDFIWNESPVMNRLIDVCLIQE